MTGCQDVSRPFRSQRGLVGRMRVKRPEKGLKWRLWREHATYVQTAQLLFQYAVMAKVAAHESPEKNRRKTTSYNNLPKTKRHRFLPKPDNVACRSILTSCRVGSAGTGSCAAATADPTSEGRGAWTESRVTSGLCSDFTSNRFGFLHPERTQFREVEAGTLKGWPCRKLSWRQARPTLDREAQGHEQWDRATVRDVESERRLGVQGAGLRMKRPWVAVDPDCGITTICLKFPQVKDNRCQPPVEHHDVPAAGPQGLPAGLAVPRVIDGVPSARSPRTTTPAILSSSSMTSTRMLMTTESSVSLNDLHCNNQGTPRLPRPVT